MSGDGTRSGTRVELYARTSLSNVAGKRRDQVATQLEELATAGHISHVEIHNWTKKVPLDAESRERRRYEQFSEWAEDVGVDLAPFFDTRTCYSMDSGAKGECLVLPVLCLAVYRDETLQSVYPHTTNDGSRSVMDCLRSIESARQRAPGGKTDPEAVEKGTLETTN
ncbi:HTH domain-containing protein [Halorientalis salina]|uniref:HTH domain-containing protein n=1 Tax=Halorientalis salina TaxID=2932266 RepID=UPI0010AC5813|nr:HTH domain-containing protein [Halorientalis salina]